jgi:hypothetical protein
VKDEKRNVYRLGSEIKRRWRKNIRNCGKLVKRRDVKKRLIVIEGEYGMSLSKEDKANDKEIMSKDEESEFAKTRN